MIINKCNTIINNNKTFFEFGMYLEHVFVDHVFMFLKSASIKFETGILLLCKCTVVAHQVIAKVFRLIILCKRQFDTWIDVLYSTFLHVEFLTFFGITFL